MRDERRVLSGLGEVSSERRARRGARAGVSPRGGERQRRSDAHELNERGGGVVDRLQAPAPALTSRGRPQRRVDSAACCLSAMARAGRLAERGWRAERGG